MESCYFCGETNPLVLENAHLIPQSVGKQVVRESEGEINVERTISLCRNCHKKFETLLRPFVKYTKLHIEEKEEGRNGESEPVEIVGYLKEPVTGDVKGYLDIYTEDSYDPFSERPFATLRYANVNVIDKALSLKKDKKFGKFIVKDGFVIDIIPTERVSIPTEEEELNIDLVMSGKARSLRDKKQVVLGTLIEMEKDTGMVEKSELLEKLETEREIARGEAEALLIRMLKDGTIWVPKERYLKKT